MDKLISKKLFELIELQASSSFFFFELKLLIFLLVHERGSFENKLLHLHSVLKLVCA